MRILITALADIRKVPPQRPHHLIHYLSSHHDLTVRSVQTSQMAVFPDGFTDDLIRQVDFSYLTTTLHHPLIQESSAYLNHSFRKWLDAQDFDLHLNLNSLIAGYGIGKKLKSRNVPSVLDICDDLPERFAHSPHVPWGFRSVARAVTHHLMQRNIRNASRVTYSGELMGAAYDLPVSKSSLIPNGVDCDHFRPLPGDGIRQILGIGADDFVCGFIGVFSQWTALDMVIETARKLIEKDTRIKFLLVGEGDQSSVLRQLARDAGISSHVLFPGRISYQDAPSYIAAMDVGLIPLKPTADCHHAHPMKLFEYMACEKPVIASPVRGVCTIAGDRILYAGSQKELIARIQELAHGESYRRALGKAGRIFVQESFTWEKILRRFDEILKDVVNEEISAH